MALRFVSKGRAKSAADSGSFRSKKEVVFRRIKVAKTKKNTFFKKRTEEVIETKGLALKNKPEQTGKRSGEVVENTYLWKNKPKNEPSDLVENKR